MQVPHDVVEQRHVGVDVEHIVAQTDEPRDNRQRMNHTPDRALSATRRRAADVRLPPAVAHARRPQHRLPADGPAAPHRRAELGADVRGVAADEVVAVAERVDVGERVQRERAAADGQVGEGREQLRAPGRGARRSTRRSVPGRQRRSAFDGDFEVGRWRVVGGSAQILLLERR